MTTRIRDYEEAKELYESVVPIRGRASDVRPIGDRRRDHEIIRKLHVRHEDQMIELYACRLYSTDVITYYPDGKIVLDFGGWMTKSTIGFMSLCGAYVHTRSGVAWYKDKHGKYHPFYSCIEIKDGEVLNPKPYKRRVVDREESAKIRQSIKPFVDFGVSMLKLSDGWLRYSTCAEIPADETVRWAMGSSHQADKALWKMETSEPDNYMAMLISVLNAPPHGLKPVSSQWVGTDTHGYAAYDKQYTVAQFKTRINSLIYALDDVWTTEECMPTTCTRDNVII
jgi:hypothetical protein